MDEKQAALRQVYLSDDGVRYPIAKAVADAIRSERTVCVLGFGISNRPLVGVLLRLGARVCVYDQKSMDALGEQAAAYFSDGVKFVHTDEAWLRMKPAVIFRSPGIRPDIPPIVQAVEQGATLGGEMDWLLERTPATVIAITGSDGKSTTTTLTAKMLEASGARVFLGGNLGTPLLDQLADMSADDFVVVELSSFQLSTPLRAPTRAAITNVTLNHLNWHRDMDEYVNAKRTICGRETRLITNAENDIVRRIALEHASRGGAAVLFATDNEKLAVWEQDTVCCEQGMVRYCCADGSKTDILPADELLLPGWHNLQNFMTAAALVMGYASTAAMAAVGKSFGGVEHRLERVRQLRGVTFYNSSIDSSPTRTAAALSALPKRSAVVICGGYDKKIPFAPLAEVLCERAGAVVLTGATAQAIFAALQACPAYHPSHLRVEIRSEFNCAVDTAAQLAWEGYGANVLLSPACASFDAFTNFEERGRAFRQRVATYNETTEQT